jgi:hypothetical protein
MITCFFVLDSVLRAVLHLLICICSTILPSLDETYLIRYMIFLDTYDPPNLSQENINNLNRSLTNN